MHYSFCYLGSFSTTDKTDNKRSARKGIKRLKIIIYYMFRYNILSSFDIDLYTYFIFHVSFQKIVYK